MNKLIAIAFLSLSALCAGAQSIESYSANKPIHVGDKCRTGAFADWKGKSYFCGESKVWQEMLGGGTSSTFTCTPEACPTSLYTNSTFARWKQEPIMKIDSPIEGKDGTTHYAFHAEKGWTCKTILGSDSKSFVFICTLDEPKPEPPPTPSAPTCTITPSPDSPSNPLYQLTHPDGSAGEMVVKPVNSKQLTPDLPWFVDPDPNSHRVLK